MRPLTRAVRYVKKWRRSSAARPVRRSCGPFSLAAPPSGFPGASTPRPDGIRAAAASPGGGSGGGRGTGGSGKPAGFRIVKRFERASFPGSVSSTAGAESGFGRGRSGSDRKAWRAALPWDRGCGGFGRPGRGTVTKNSKPPGCGGTMGVWGTTKGTKNTKDLLAFGAGTLAAQHCQFGRGNEGFETAEEPMAPRESFSCLAWAGGGRTARPGIPVPACFHWPIAGRPPLPSRGPCRPAALRTRNRRTAT